MNPKIEIKEKIVTQIQERVRTITKEKVSPDGTRETVTEIVSLKDTNVLQESTVKRGSPDRSIFVTSTIRSIQEPRPIYGLGVAKELFLGLSGGLYARSNGEFGLTVLYRF